MVEDHGRCSDIDSRRIGHRFGDAVASYIVDSDDDGVRRCWRERRRMRRGLSCCRATIDLHSVVTDSALVVSTIKGDMRIVYIIGRVSVYCEVECLGISSIYLYRKLRRMSTDIAIVVCLCVSDMMDSLR